MTMKGEHLNKFYLYAGGTGNESTITDIIVPIALLSLILLSPFLLCFTSFIVKSQRYELLHKTSIPVLIVDYIHKKIPAFIERAKNKTIVH